MPHTAACRLALTLALIGLTAGDALAHHPTGGQMPTSLWHGFLSGIGHPMIGPDHLAFIIAIGIAAAFMPGGVVLAIAFAVASSIGVIAHVQSIGIPNAELLVSLSLLAAGVVLATQRTRAALWVALAATAGLVHGYAFGETVVGAETGVIGAYLGGITLVAIAISLGVSVATRSLTGPLGADHPRIRGAGWALACMGLALSAFAFIPSA